VTCVEMDPAIEVVIDGNVEIVKEYQIGENF
jgi:hypothetical protein